MKLVLITLCLFAIHSSYALDWAVIVAGSNGWGNYRHQADACHARKLANANGIPDSRIITMVYDDLAHNTQNPYPGMVFNKPSTGAGVDVYAGCVQQGDYTGADVTVANFIYVLLGEDTKVPAGKKVLKSTSDDNVFINFVDHGGVGIIAFPNAMMTNAQLISTLRSMKSLNMYNKLVFYLETCESGSMFAGLLDPSLGIYVTTASGPAESSWGTYCPPDDVVDGKTMNTCLGDLYEVSWMEDIEAVGKQETLEEQYKTIKVKVNLSAVMQYGDLNYTDLPVGDFIGGASARYSVHKKPTHEEVRKSSTVSSRDIPLHLAYYKYLRADSTNFEERQLLSQQLISQLSLRSFYDKLFMNLAIEVGGDESFFHAAPETPIVCGDCCAVVNNAIQQYCGGYDDYSLQYSRVVYNLCVSSESRVILDTLKQMCQSK